LSLLRLGGGDVCGVRWGRVGGGVPGKELPRRDEFPAPAAGGAAAYPCPKPNTPASELLRLSPAPPPSRAPPRSRAAAPGSNIGGGPCACCTGPALVVGLRVGLLNASSGAFRANTAASYDLKVVRIVHRPCRRRTLTLPLLAVLLLRLPARVMRMLRSAEPAPRKQHLSPGTCIPRPDSDCRRWLLPSIFPCASCV
jgi:hypothetical protein